jgi:hypothetical protein
MQEYADLTLDELVEIQQKWAAKFEAARKEYKQRMAGLQPYLDAAWAEHTANEAAKSDPALDQGIG